MYMYIRPTEGCPTMDSNYVLTVLRHVSFVTWIDAERAVKKIAQRKTAPEIDCSE